MSPAAQHAQLDFVRLVAEEPSSLYFEQFLRDGFDAWPASYQRRFPGLQTWPGVAGLKQSLRRLANAPHDWQVLLASRSLSLVHLAAQRLFRICTNVLATDLSWPTYQDTLERNASATGKDVSTVPLRNEILEHCWSVEDVSDYLAEECIVRQCDGLFLPAVDHLGIRLPVRKIVERIRCRSELNFVLIDAAQAFCHVPLDDCLAVADFVVAGSHKWMQAYLPTGIGLSRCHRRQSTSDGQRQVKDVDLWQDPVLCFTEQIHSDKLDCHSETVNVANLMACAGAVSDALNAVEGSTNGTIEFVVSDFFRQRPDIGDDWVPISPVPPMRTQIAILRSETQQIRQLSEGELRHLWLKEGCVVSAYPNGVIRISTHCAIRREIVC